MGEGEDRTTSIHENKYSVSVLSEWVMHMKPKNSFQLFNYSATQ
jgi:hypothetical protein